ncbi:MAG TPA: 50S ribosomal protein L11 methyltransferase [Pyrinomonadaceae bacterium]|nr:50S ribosomal protein L11 methyltransferase [Pyrinomonadaceae bacterium]
MKKNAAAEKDAQFYQHMQQALLYHQFLLRDEVRNKLFYEALRRTVTSEKRVLDIGSGSGVWAIAAAKLGAKSVTAIESNETMIPMIMAHAAENGVADRIEIINGYSSDIGLKHKYDVIVSETIGNQAFEEDIIPTMVDARDRFLAPGGVLIPQTVALKAAPAHLISETETPLGVPVTTNYLNNLAFNVTGKLAVKEHLELLAPAAKLLEVDLRECEADQSFNRLTAEWEIEDMSRANVLALSAESELADGVVLDTMATLNWMPIVCRFRPFAPGPGRLFFGLSVDQKRHHWTVRSSDGSQQAYTPMFAYTKIKLDSQRAPRRRRTKKH